MNIADLQPVLPSVVTTWLQDDADGTSLDLALQRSVLPAMAKSLKVDDNTIRQAFLDAMAGASVTVTIGEGK